LHRILGQFGPYVWVDYDWKPLSSIGRWCGVLALAATVSIGANFWWNGFL